MRSEQVHHTSGPRSCRAPPARVLRPRPVRSISRTKTGDFRRRSKLAVHEVRAETKPDDHQRGDGGPPCPSESTLDGPDTRPRAQGRAGRWHAPDVRAVTITHALAIRTRCTCTPAKQQPTRAVIRSSGSRACRGRACTGPSGRFSTPPASPAASGGCSTAPPPLPFAQSCGRASVSSSTSACL